MRSGAFVCGTRITCGGRRLLGWERYALAWLRVVRAPAPAALPLRGGKELCAFRVLANHVQAEEVGGAGLGAGSGDDGDDLALADEAILLEQVLGHIDQRLGGVDLGAADGGCTPEQVEAIDGDIDRAEGVDGRRGMILGELAGS